MKKIPGALCFQWLRGFRILFPLDGRGGLPCNIVDDAAGTLDFIDDAGRHDAEHIVRDRRVFARHEVRRAHGAQRDRIVIRPEIADDADRADAGQDGEILVGADAVPDDLFAEDGVGVLQDADFFRCEFAQHAHAEAGPGNGCRSTKRRGRPS